MDSASPVPRPEAGGMERERAAWNRRYAPAGALIALVAALIFLAQHLWAPGPLGPLSPAWLGDAYAAAYILLALSGVAFILAFAAAGRRSPGGPAERIVLFVFAFIMSGLGIVLTLFDLHTGRDYMGLMAGMLCTCLLVSAPSAYYYSLTAWAVALFSAGFLALHPQRGFSDFVGGIFAAMMCGTLGLLVQHARGERFSTFLRLREEAVARSKALVRDEVTGAYNGVFLIECLSRMAAGGSRYRQELSLLVLDVDRLGRINENFGREAADGILAELGKALAVMVRSSDIVARLDGGRFAVVMPQTGGAAAAEVGERLRAAFQEMSFRGVKSLLSVSVGVASLRAEEDVGAFVSRADSALRRAKAGGRNRVERIQ